MKRLVLIAVLLLGCASMRMRTNPQRLRHIETIVPVTFVGNHYVPSDDIFAATEQNDATAEMIFTGGVPAFLEALKGTERFKVVDPSRVLAAKSYAAFPSAFAGLNSSGVQLAFGWRYVRPEDAEKIRNLLEEVDADAALLTYWRFSLDNRTRGDVGVQSATTRAHLRAWLVDRDGQIVADDEIDVPSDESLPMQSGHYDARFATPLFDDAITTCAVRMVADFANARAKARGE